jgi:hypothetical protein
VSRTDAYSPQRRSSTHFVCHAAPPSTTASTKTSENALICERGSTLIELVPERLRPVEE